MMSYTPMTSHLPKPPMPGEKNFRKNCNFVSMKKDNKNPTGAMKKLPPQQRDMLAESIRRSWKQVKQMEAGEIPVKSAMTFVKEL